MKDPIRCLFLLSLCAVAALASPSAFAVGTQRVVLRVGDDFKGGDLQGVAVDSSGAVRAGFNLGSVPLPDATTIWAALEMPDGSLLLGTGNEGKLFKLAGGVVTLMSETKGLTVTSLAPAWQGTVAVGSLPNGTVHRLQNGKLTELVRLKDVEHVWSVAFDGKSNVLYAGTGPEGKVFRITQGGEAQLYFDADEQHIMSVAVGPDGRVYAGASDKAKLYEITAPGRAQVLFDFGRTEVRAIRVSQAGDVYAIANEIKASGGGNRRSAGDAAQPVSAGNTNRGKGTLYRFTAAGEPEQLLDEKEDHFVSLALGNDGRPYVGTGAEGRVYSVDGNHNSVLVADTQERQVTELLLAGRSQYVVSSDPPVVHPVRSIGGADAVWTSKVLDLGIRGRFGLLGWTASGALELSTRSGNSSEPDKTWSDWSAPLAAPGNIQSPPARYFQVRARFNRDPAAVLHEVVIPFVTDNLRHVVTSVEAEQAATEGIAKIGTVKASGGPITKKPESKISLKWSVDNPDNDELRYRLYFRLVGTTTWYDLLKSGEKLIGKDSYGWETSELPEGRYRVRVVASDDPANPPARVTRHEFESPIVIVDNTAPTLLDLAVNGRKVRGIAVDGVSPIARIEAALAASDDWQPYFPSDGIFDEQREEFEIDVTNLAPSGPALLTLRVYDQTGNFVVRSVALK